MTLKAARRILAMTILSQALVANLGPRPAHSAETAASPFPSAGHSLTDAITSSEFAESEDWLRETGSRGDVHIEPAIMRTSSWSSSTFVITPVSAVVNDVELTQNLPVEDLSESCGHTDFGTCCDPQGWRPLDTLTLFGGLEGSKQPQDFGVNANFGSRWAANWGFPLLADYGIGGQIGTSINYTDNAVQVFERVGQSTHRTQNFSTIGVFQRTDTWRWGIAYDLLYESYYDQFLLGQWRGRVGYATSAKNEFGVWFAVPQQRSNGNFSTIPVQLMTLTQGSAYWQHQFSAGSRLMCWGGVAEGHAQANLALGDLPRTGPQFVFGAEVDVPLNSYFSLYGQANFVGPADTGTVDSFLGIAYYPGGQAFPVTRSPFSPFQALVNSTMFAVDMRRN